MLGHITVPPSKLEILQKLFSIIQLNNVLLNAVGFTFGGIIVQDNRNLFMFLTRCFTRCLRFYFHTDCPGPPVTMTVPQGNVTL